MKDLKMQYKADTGYSAYFEKGSEHLTHSIDPFPFKEMTAKEIISALEYDTKHNAKWGVFMEDIPDAYLDGLDLKLITPGYVEWLENKIHELTKD